MKRILLAMALVLTGCTQIDTGNVGVESTMGQVKMQGLPSGVYFTLFKTLYEVSARENVSELVDMKPKTSDNVTLADLDVNVYWKIGPSHAPTIMTKYAGDMIKNKDGDYVLGAGLMTRLAREASYNAVSKFNSSEAHTKRNELAADILAALQKELDGNSGKGLFEVTNVIVRNILTDPGLEQSIKQSAQVEFQIREKRQQIELAKAEAERLRVEAEGVAKANEIIAKSITLNLIEIRRVEMTGKFAEKGTHTVLLPQGVQPLVQVR